MIMRWLINYIKSLFCKHEWELIFEATVTDRLLGNTYHCKTYRCCKCGYSKRYKSS